MTVPFFPASTFVAAGGAAPDRSIAYLARPPVCRTFQKLDVRFNSSPHRGSVAHVRIIAIARDERSDTYHRRMCREHMDGVILVTKPMRRW